MQRCGSGTSSSSQKHCSEKQQPLKATHGTFHTHELADRDEIVAGSDQNTLPWPGRKKSLFCTKSVACMQIPKIPNSPPSKVTSKRESRQPGEQDQRGSSSSTGWHTCLGCRSTRIHTTRWFFYIFPTEETLLQETAIINDLPSFITYWEKYWGKKNVTR